MTIKQVSDTTRFGMAFGVLFYVGMMMFVISNLSRFRHLIVTSI